MKGHAKTLSGKNQARLKALKKQYVAVYLARSGRESAELQRLRRPEWIEGWYNSHRRHSGLSNRSRPINERAHYQARGRMAELLPPPLAAADFLLGKIGKAT